MRRLPAALRVGFTLAKYLTTNEVRCTPGGPGAYQKGFPMLTSMRPGATALRCLPCSIVSSAQARRRHQAHPFFFTEGAGKNSIVGSRPHKSVTGMASTRISGQGKGQRETIPIVDAFDDPNIEQDLARFSSTFGLPGCTPRNVCSFFQKVYATATGSTGSKPDTNSMWAFEISLDVKSAHAIAPKSKHSSGRGRVRPAFGPARRR